MNHQTLYILPREENMILSLNTGVSNDVVLLIIRNMYPDVVSLLLILLTVVYPRGSYLFSIDSHLTPFYTISGNTAHCFSF